MSQGSSVQLQFTAGQGGDHRHKQITHSGQAWLNHDRQPRGSLACSSTKCDHNSPHTNSDSTCTRNLHCTTPRHRPSPLSEADDGVLLGTRPEKTQEVRGSKMVPLSQIFGLLLLCVPGEVKFQFEPALEDNPHVPWKGWYLDGTGDDDTETP